MISLISYLNKNIITQCDAPVKYQGSFQDPATPMFEGTIFLHDLIWAFLFFVVIFVTWMLGRTLVLFKEDPSKRVNPVTQNVTLETVWTLSPAIILALLAGNSISHLYSVEEALTPSMDVVITGNQWFWIYEIMVFDKKYAFESHMIAEEDLKIGELRNLEVDNPLILPIETNIRLIVNSNDVIHSWAVPSLGVKIDAVPGRTNTGFLYIKREGRFYGQCSEICGKGHAYMPIIVVALDPMEYLIYLHYLYLGDSDLPKNWGRLEFNSIKKEIFGK
jgi:cytochrome c oxidase subunit 2